MKAWEHIADPEARTHGDAWRAFHSTIKQRPVTLSDTAMRHDWLVFLAGWIAKGKQRDDLRRRR